MLDILELIGAPLLINIVDIGALSLGPGTDPYDTLLKATSTRVTGFEPVQEECEKLNRMHGNNRRYLPYVIGNGGPGVFHLCNDPVTSSLYPPYTELLDKFQNIENLTQVVKEIPVQTRRLDDIAEIGDVDFLKVDVQGAEVDVFSGASRTLRNVVAIHTEVQFVPLYRGVPLFSEVDIALRKHGFLLHRFASIGGRCFKPMFRNNDINTPGSQLLWGDAVYLPNFMDLNGYTPEKLLKLAVILHTVYQSVDTCAFVLREHQNRTGSGLADRYILHLTQSAGNQGPQAPS